MLAPEISTVFFFINVSPVSVYAVRVTGNTVRRQSLELQQGSLCTSTPPSTPGEVSAVGEREDGSGVLVRVSTEAPFRQIVGQIRAQIDGGQLRPGDRVLSAGQITAE